MHFAQTRGRRRKHGPTASIPASALAALLAASPAHALSVIGVNPPPPTDAERDCYELAAEISEALDVRSGTAGFWSRTDNQIGAVMTVIAPLPALGYLGYNAYYGFRQDQVAEQAEARIGELRRRSAEKQCFVRP